MDSPIEKTVPSTNTTMLWTVLSVTCALFLLMLSFLYKGFVGGGLEYLLGGAYGTAMSLIAAYFISHQIRNPDRLKIDDSGFEYSFINLTFRVGWEDVEEISFDDSDVIKVKLRSPEKAAYNSLVRKGPVYRTQFNPYAKVSLKRAVLFRRNWIKSKSDLAQYLHEAGRESGFHIAIPVFESTEEAERLYNEMKQRSARWRPAYKPLSITDPQMPEDSINDDAKSEEAPRQRLRQME